VNYLIHDVSRLRRQLFDQEMRPHGVTHVQWTTLAQLSRSPTGSMAQVDLARLLDAGVVAVSRRLDRLEAIGLVERRPAPADRRVNLVHLTRKAGKILARMAEVSRRVNARLLHGLSEREIEAMERGLAMLKRNARAQLHDEGG
jgi:DNA-binding MarR family transcriptional regulator